LPEISHSSDTSAPQSLVFEIAEPLVQRIVRWRLGATAPFQDREDVVGDILLELLARLDGVRRGQSEPVADFAGYAAVAAHHGCDRYLRRRFPQRYRLGTRLRYLLEHSALYAVWHDGEGFVCAPVRHRGEAPESNLRPGWAAQIALPPHPNETSAVAALFAHTDAAIRLSDLIDAVAALLNIDDRVASISDNDIAARGPDHAANRDLRLDLRQTLARLWAEIGLLPQPQRFALLLNLRDEDGGCALTSLPETGVASIREIARAIEIPAPKLAELWKDLPLNDLAIAAMLGISRQQVINLRKSARERLARRMASNIGPKSDSKKENRTNV
jgi:DNA-directed RNA polymerase specialized sigma24 family protein